MYFDYFHLLSCKHSINGYLSSTFFIYINIPLTKRGIARRVSEVSVCQNKGRPEMTDRRRRPEMTDQRQHVRR